MNDCIFCRIAGGEISSNKVYEDEHTFAFLDIQPKSEYHTLVIPKKHYETIFDIPEEEAVHVMRAVKRVTDLYRNKLKITDVQLIANNGKNAQQEVPHLHFHILPRKKNDGSNFKWPPAREELCGRLGELIEKII